VLRIPEHHQQVIVVPLGHSLRAPYVNGIQIDSVMFKNEADYAMGRMESNCPFVLDVMGETKSLVKFPKYLR
jgi:hypothetical protein